MTARAVNEQSEFPPSPEEIAAAINAHATAVAAHRETYDAAMAARERLVEVLKRAGVRGFSL